MIAETGHATLWLATAFALLASLGPRLKLDLAVPAAIIAALLGLASLLTLIWSFHLADFSLILIDDRVHRLQPPLVRLAMMVTSPAGSLLILATLLAAFATITPRVAPVSFVAFAATLVLAPFARQPFVPPEGRALTLPVDLAATLWQPPLLALAAALLLAVLLHGPLTRPPRWMGLVAVASLLLGGGAVAAARLGAETSALLKPGQAIRLQGVTARLVSLAPAAGPGYTAIEAKLAIGDTVVTPQARTLIHSTVETPVPADTRIGLGRIEATLGPARGEAREVRLRWSPL